MSLQEPIYYLGSATVSCVPRWTSSNKKLMQVTRVFFFGRRMVGGSGAAASKKPGFIRAPRVIIN